MTEAIRDAFRKQATLCAAVGSPLMGSILNALADTLDHQTRTGARVLDWPTDPMIDALPIRLCGGLNAIVRAGEDVEMAQLQSDNR